MRVPDKRYDHKAVEEKYADFWRKAKVYARVKKQNAQGKEFYFVDGPPYASGPVHLGTARNKVIKDAFLRFKRMQGLNVRDQPGFDMHGLPIELQVEKALGVSTKKEIEAGGIDHFVGRCKEFSEVTAKQMADEFANLGVWLDWEAPYLSSSNDFIESAWWTLKKAHTAEMLVREERVVHWCPRCQTALSDSELFYTQETGHSMYLKLPIRGRRDEYLLIWTTDPWSLTANLAVAVNPDRNYAKVKIRKGGRRETIFIVEENVESVANSTEIEAYEIEETMMGERLVGLSYFNPLMADIPFQKDVKGEWVHKVLPSQSVTKEHTGLAHVAPGLNQDDYEIGKAHKLPVFCPIDERGTFTTEGGLKNAGKTLAEVSKHVIDDLTSMRFMLHVDQRKNRQGHCWRCRTPIIHKVSKQWFLKVSGLRDKMLRSVKAVSWAPAYMGTGRVYNLLERSRDWCISRQRYWGVPLPVWECITDLCGHVEFVGSTKELKGKPGYKDGMNLHRPDIDNVRLECSKCGGPMKRTGDVVDVWFDSSIASWAQLGYPQKRDEFKRWWPCDWATEAHDQTKGWFYTQICASMMVFDRMPYKSALVHGWICDATGKPMSKSLDNVVAPEEVIEKYGRDALRLYLLYRGAPWDDVKYNPEDIKKATRFFNNLWSVYHFASAYMAMDSYDLTTKMESVQKNLRPEDRWLVSRLESLKDAVMLDMQSSNVNRAIQAIEEFVVQDLSHWYIKLVRDRAWAEGKKEDKTALYKTLNEALVTVSRLLAPYAPYISEELYQNLDGEHVSVHLCKWPASDKERKDAKIDQEMKIAREIVDAANQARQLIAYKLRWPVKRITIEAKEEKVAEAVATFEHVIKRQCNTKEIEIIPVGQEWARLEIQVHPNPNAIGKSYKMWEKQIARMLQIRPAKKIKEDVDRGVYKLGIEGQLIDILPEMVTFTSKLPDDVVSGEITNGNVYINVEIDDEIRSEGYARDVVRRTQEMRKELAMDVEDYIKLSISTNDNVQPLLEKWEDMIMAEARCSELSFAVENEEEYVVEWKLGEDVIVIGVTPIRMKATIDEFLKVPGMEKPVAQALFAAGYNAVVDVVTAPKEDVLKVQGMNHATLRRISEWFELPEDMKTLEENRCPVCDVQIEQGAVQCQRCGERLIPGEVGEAELSDALEQTLAGEPMEGEAGEPISKVAGRASKLLEVIEDLRKPLIKTEEVDAEQVLPTARSLREELEAELPKPQPRRPEPPREPQPVNVEPDEVVEEITVVTERKQEEVKTSESKKEREQELTSSAEELLREMPKPSKSEVLEKKRPEDELPIPSDVTEEAASAGGMDKSVFIEMVSETAEINLAVAKSLYEAGFNTIEKLKAATEDDLRGVEKVGKVTARKIVEAYSGLAKGETQMCELCNAIVGIDAKACPRCGTPFEGGDGEERDERETRIIEKQMKTVEALDKRLVSKPEDPDLLYSKAMTVMEMGDRQEAERLLKATIASDPNHSKAMETLRSLSGERAAEVEVKPEASLEKPKFEELPPSEPSSDDTLALKESFTYLFREERSQRAYQILRRYVSKGKRGFCVTRNFPDKVRDMYQLGETPILWLSNVGTKDAVRPKDLEKLSLSLEQFLAKQGGIVLLDGLEYLITNNNFITVLRLIQSLRDQVAINRSILILPVNPSTMSTNELNLLEKEVDVVIN